MQVLSEGPVRITKSTIDAVWRRRKPDARLIVRDAECRGLALVVNPTVMSWTYSYRPRGLDPITGKRASNRSITLGNPATLTPDEARIAANRIKGAAATGEDPAEERRTKVKEAQRKRALTIARMRDDYKVALPLRPKLSGKGRPSPRHVAEELAHVTAAIKALEADDRPISSITPADIRRVMAAVADKPASARARFGAVSRFFEWCLEEEYVAVNPCNMLPRGRRPKAVAARAHFLTPAQLAMIWKAAEGLTPVHRDLVRLLIAVPSRRSEATRLDWAHLDLDDGVWTMPGSMTKNGDQHRISLPDLALTILRERHEAAKMPRTGLVFPAPKSGTAIDTFSDIKSTIEKATELKGWRWHDFRRSFATALGEAGVAEPVADAILNHRQSATRGGVLGVYQRAQRRPEQVTAMQVWNTLLADAITPQAAANDIQPSATVTLLRPAKVSTQASLAGASALQRA